MISRTKVITHGIDGTDGNSLEGVGGRGGEGEGGGRGRGRGGGRGGGSSRYRNILKRLYLTILPFFDLVFCNVSNI